MPLRGPALSCPHHTPSRPALACPTQAPHGPLVLSYPIHVLLATHKQPKSS
jgi:hypothetical protein